MLNGGKTVLSGAKTKGYIYFLRLLLNDQLDFDSNNLARTLRDLIIALAAGRTLPAVYAFRANVTGGA
jgi:hypothetical protein